MLGLNVMARFKAGDFEANVWEGGWPVWTQLVKRGEYPSDTVEFHGLSIQDLRDLQHLIKGALREAKAQDNKMKNP